MEGKSELCFCLPPASQWGASPVPTPRPLIKPHPLGPTPPCLAPLKGGLSLHHWSGLRAPFSWVPALGPGDAGGKGQPGGGLGGSGLFLLLPSEGQWEPGTGEELGGWRRRAGISAQLSATMGPERPQAPGPWKELPLSALPRLPAALYPRSQWSPSAWAFPRPRAHAYQHPPGSHFPQSWKLWLSHQRPQGGNDQWGRE